MFITLPDQAPFAFAGLWETWHDKQNPDEPYRSCTIITREAAGAVKELHHRMPVILEPDAYSHWLDSDNRNADSINEMLHSRSITDLIFYPVAKQVNSVSNNDLSNIKPIQTEFDF